jgi:peptide/nickel transport system permease protein
MAHFILRRLAQALATIAGVMVVTFVLFRVMAGDIAAANLGPQATEQMKAQWRHQHGYDQPLAAQFVHYMKDSALLQARSLKTNERLVDIIGQRGPYSLSITLPALAFKFTLGLWLACLAAYCRGRLVDRIGVCLSVLGMCIPFLAFMIYGQWLMFLIAPRHAYGVFCRANLYLPIAIMVVAGLGGTVRFYRTVILEEAGRDYVRTARAKGVAPATILMRHVLPNCMGPILTNLVLSIPLLVMGSLLVESYFGIPGLGDLVLTSVGDRNEPILSGLVFLTAVIYTVGVLVADLAYAVADPRIRLR